MKKDNFIKLAMFLSINFHKTEDFFDSPEKLYPEYLENNPGIRTGWIGKIYWAPDLFSNPMKKARLSLGYVYNNIDSGIHLDLLYPGFYVGFNSAHFSLISNISFTCGIDSVSSRPVLQYAQLSIEICKNQMLFGFSTFIGISLSHNLMKEQRNYFCAGLVLGIQRNQTEGLILDKKIRKAVKKSKIKLEANRRYSNWLKEHSTKDKMKDQGKEKKSDKDNIIVRTDKKI